MLIRRRKTSSKLAENQPSVFIFLQTIIFSAFSLHRGLQPPSPSSSDFSPSSPPPVAIKRSQVAVAPFLSLSSLYKSSPLPPWLQQRRRQQSQQPPPCPEALFLPKGSRGNSSFLSHTNSSIRELSFSFAGLCSFFFQPWPVQAASLTTFSYTVHHQLGRRLSPRQATRPSPATPSFSFHRGCMQNSFLHAAAN